MAVGGISAPQGFERLMAPATAGVRSSEKLALLVARQIEADVLRRGWPVGEPLGSEVELRATYPVSRAVLREAIRLVEHHQVAEMRRGATGGLYVCAPGAGPAAQAAVMYLSYAGVQVQDFLRVRRALEPLAARLAAERITEEGIAKLRECAEAESTEPGSSKWAPDALHDLVAQLSGNPALRLFLGVLTRLLAEYGDLVANAAPESVRQAGKEAHSSHLEIVEAIISGSVGRAEATIREHNDYIIAWSETNPPRRRRRRAQAPVRRLASSHLPVKLGESLAMRIHHDIAMEGQALGSVVGSERDLLERYGVSRAVLREAIRLLRVPRRCPDENRAPRRAHHYAPGSTGKHRHHGALPGVSARRQRGSADGARRDRTGHRVGPDGPKGSAGGAVAADRPGQRRSPPSRGTG